jgi:hypothetical protein
MRDLFSGSVVWQSRVAFSNTLRSVHATALHTHTCTRTHKQQPEATATAADASGEAATAAAAVVATVQATQEALLRYTLARGVATSLAQLLSALHSRCGALSKDDDSLSVVARLLGLMDAIACFPGSDRYYH